MLITQRANDSIRRAKVNKAREARKVCSKSIHDSRRLQSLLFVYFVFESSSARCSSAREARISIRSAGRTQCNEFLSLLAETCSDYRPLYRILLHMLWLMPYATAARRRNRFPFRLRGHVLLRAPIVVLVKKWQ